ncbi:11085_t:CDS:1, partial [Racocetra persica]
MELFDDTESINATINEGSNELFDETISENDNIGHQLIYDTDFSDEESDVSSLKITLGKHFCLKLY